jgi:hypothetical protein
VSLARGLLKRGPGRVFMAVEARSRMQKHFVSSRQDTWRDALNLSPKKGFLAQCVFFPRRPFLVSTFRSHPDGVSVAIGGDLRASKA